MSYSEDLLQVQGNLLTHFAHRSRFSFTLDVLEGQKFERALDYGCGDGLLLLRASERGVCQAGVGVDFDPQMLDQGRTKFGGRSSFEFCTPEDLRAKQPDGSFDLAFCTEALEHIRNPAAALDLMVAKLRPGGLLVVSVPIEIGPALLIKQAGRFSANLRKATYGYERYSWSELVAAGLRGDTASWPNSHNGREGAEHPHTGHRGFDYRKIESLVRDRVRITRTICSPIPALGPAFNSTIFWLADKRLS